MAHDDIKKVYPHNHEATLVCEKCGRTRKIDTSKYEERQRGLKVKCGCGFEFLVLIEPRKFYRKPTQLHGDYVKIAAKRVSGTMVVRNLSRTGVGFETSSTPDVRPGDRLQIRFVLDNRKATEIKRDVMVKSVQDRFIGAEFCNLEAYESDLGFYLMNG